MFSGQEMPKQMIMTASSRSVIASPNSGEDAHGGDDGQADGADHDQDAHQRRGVLDPVGVVHFRQTQGAAERAGDGYSVYVGVTRANVSVGTATEEAAADNLDRNTLEKAIR